MKLTSVATVLAAILAAPVATAQTPAAAKPPKWDVSAPPGIGVDIKLDAVRDDKRIAVDRPRPGVVSHVPRYRDHRIRLSPQDASHQAALEPDRHAVPDMHYQPTPAPEQRFRQSGDEPGPNGFRMHDVRREAVPDDRPGEVTGGRAEPVPGEDFAVRGGIVVCHASNLD